MVVRVGGGGGQWIEVGGKTSGRGEWVGTDNECGWVGVSGRSGWEGERAGQNDILFVNLHISIFYVLILSAHALTYLTPPPSPFACTPSPLLSPFPPSPSTTLPPPIQQTHTI